mmetsp:Transcript_1999/g.3891  ORF Transcript_1999/g.3891 Transcript_1999/m.3891 type:complete len:206 (-) Transcript_1999:4536-5153(-)
MIGWLPYSISISHEDFASGLSMLLTTEHTFLSSVVNFASVKCVSTFSTANCLSSTSGLTSLPSREDRVEDLAFFETFDTKNSSCVTTGLFTEVCRARKPLLMSLRTSAGDVYLCTGFVPQNDMQLSPLFSSGSSTTGACSFFAMNSRQILGEMMLRLAMLDHPFSCLTHSPLRDVTLSLWWNFNMPDAFVFFEGYALLKYSTPRW